MIRVPVQPELLIWARERADFGLDDLRHRFPKIGEWESGEIQPTLKQLQAFANAVHVPIGYLFLPTPPDETLPIPDFRTMDGAGVHRASPDLLDVIYSCQERQDWYREYARANRVPEPPFVGSATTSDAPESMAAVIADTLGLSVAARAAYRNWEAARREMIAQAEDAGVLVMVSGVGRSNSHRKLDPAEFRGFALADTHAPLIFINGADSKSAQMFTLAHELAHLWLGSTAVSNASAVPVNDYRAEEVWCNAVAAELLVPVASLREETGPNDELDELATRLTRQYKVSRLVILRRLLDSGWLSRDDFARAWAAELARIRQQAERNRGDGGHFYNTTLARVGRRFAGALAESTLEGQTLYRDAFHMMGVKKTETFERVGRDAGVMMLRRERARFVLGAR